MRGRAGLAALGLLALGAAPLAGAVQAELSSSREASGEEMSEIRGYSDRLGRELLKENLGLDLDALQVELDPGRVLFGRSSSGASSHANDALPGLSQGPAPGLTGYLRLRLEQGDDLRRLQAGLREIPFGLSVSGQLPLLANLAVLETSFWVPFSWREEFRAQASLPLLDGLQGRKLILRSDFRNQLGLSKVDAGLGTDVASDSFGLWDVDYDFQRNFGQGEDEAIHWLKFSRHF
jgi:hypothetical protein